VAAGVDSAWRARYAVLAEYVLTALDLEGVPLALAATPAMRLRVSRHRRL